MKSCWAIERGGCDQGISREHLLSKGIFDDSFVYVKGFHWCRDVEVRVGLSSLTGKVLCGFHNSALSPVDIAGIKIVRYFDQLYPNIENLPSEKTEPPFDGHMFERWLLKTAINISYGSSEHIGVGMTDSKPGKPSAYLLAVVFGDIPFSHKMGAYFIYPKGEYLVRKGEISLVPVIKSGEIGGFYFHLRGLDIFLSLFPGHAPPSLEEIGVTGFPDHILHAELQYRSSSLILRNEGAASTQVRFAW